MGNFLGNVLNFITDNNMLEPQDKIIVGLSGGADSVCLLVALTSLREKLGLGKDSVIAVHINHGIRGEEAKRDENFARDLCMELGVEFKVFEKDIEAYARESKLSVEEAGRNYRYQCFREVLKEKNFTKIAVAHNKNDFAETVIFNMLRGSGLNGMSGILAVRGNIIRPLLNVSREEIEEYLSEIGQDYIIDSTNITLDYDRNRIRHIVLPEMCKINKKAVEHICQMAEEAKESYSFIHGKAMEEYDTNASSHENDKTVVLDIRQLYKVSPVLQEHMVHQALIQVASNRKDLTRKHIMSVVSLIYQGTGKALELPYGIRARHSYDELIITRASEEESDYSIPISEEGVYIIPGKGNIHISFMENNPQVEVSKKMYTKMADYDKIKGSLCIRTPEEGDYIIIDSQGRTKKLSRVFIDCKVDREKRKTWPVVAVGNEILWAIGLRYSEAYKIHHDTTKIIYMEYTEEGEM